MAVTVSYIETPPKVNLQGNPCVISVGTSVENDTDIIIHLRIQELVDDVWTDTDKEDAVTLVDGAAVFDISGYFESAFEPAFAFPEHFTNLILPRPGMVKSFRVKVWESYLDGNGVLQNKEADSLQLPETTYMIPGGISDNDHAVLNELSSNWWTEHQEAGRALNWMPGNKIVCPQSIEKIYWIQSTAETITLRFSWTDTDGNTGEYNYSLGVMAFLTYEFSVSPAIVEALAGREIAGYTVSLVDKDFSQQYTVDRAYYEWNEFFLLPNSFEVFEGMWCHGARTGKVNFNRQKYEKTDRKFQRLFDRSAGNIRATFTKVHESNTGFYSENADEWINWTIDLLNADNAWKADVNKLFPITLNQESINIEDQLDDTPWSISFEWEYSRKGKYWSNLGLIAKFMYPPYYLDLGAFFYRIQQNKLIDLINGLEAEFTDSEITWPAVPGMDVFDFSNIVFWDNSKLEWYDSGNVRTSPLSAIVGYEWANAARGYTHTVLFHRDYGQYVKNMIPTIVYARQMNEDEQQAIIDWLDWYVTILDVNGNIIPDKNNAIVTSSKIN